MMQNRYWMLSALSATVILGGIVRTAQARPETTTKGGSRMEITIESTAFKNGKSIPREHTGDGIDISPALSWTNAPTDTRAFVLIFDDPDAPSGDWVHWVIYDIPAGTTSLQKGIPPEKTVLQGAKQGVNDFRNIGYDGPAPPPGKPHRYLFKLYAIDSETGLAPGASKAEVLKAIEGHVLARGELRGVYGR